MYSGMALPAIIMVLNTTDITHANYEKKRGGKCNVVSANITKDLKLLQTDLATIILGKY